MKRWLIAAFTLTITISVVVFTQAMSEKPSLQLGVPGEWTWRYDHSPYADRALIPLVAAGLLGVLCYFARQRTLEFVGRRPSIFLALAIFFTLWLQVSFAYLGRAGFGQGIFWAGFDGANPYFGEARRTHSLTELMAEAQDPNRPFRIHVSAHPPGPVLFYYVLLRAWGTTPETAAAFTKFMEKVTPYAGESRAILEERIARRSYSNAELATLYSSILILWLLVALAVLPLYYWAASLFGQPAAIATIGFYALTPSILLFNPMTDQMVVPTAILMLASFHFGLSRRDPAKLLFAGILTWIGLQYSLSFLGLLFLFGICAFLEVMPGKHDLDRLKLLAFSALSFVVMVLLFLPFGYNSLRAWQICLTRTVQGETRSYLAWTGFNLFDFALFAGLPVTVFLVRGVFGALKRRETAAHRFTIAMAITLMALNFSGINRGEVARLWMFLMPMTTAIAAYALEEETGKARWGFPICFGLLFVQSVLFKLSLDVLLTSIELATR
jgi:hypothetical protein